MKQRTKLADPVSPYSTTDVEPDERKETASRGEQGGRIRRMNQNVSPRHSFPPKRMGRMDELRTIAIYRQAEATETKISRSWRVSVFGVPGRKNDTELGYDRRRRATPGVGREQAMGRHEAPLGHVGAEMWRQESKKGLMDERKKTEI